MPELPEVETVCRQLRTKVLNKKIHKVVVCHMKTVAHNSEFESTVKSLEFSNIDRIGKLMIFSFKNKPDLFLLAHLKMTGQFFYRDHKEVVTGGGHSMTAADIAVLPSRHTRLYFEFEDETTLYFNDMRLFGYVKIASKEHMLKARAGYGQEPIAVDFDCEALYGQMKRRRTTIKALLLNQKIVSGLGNIYVDETLFLSQVRPDRVANTITKSEAELICKFACQVMSDSITYGGTTFENFIDTGGEQGNYSDYLKVFGKQGVECSVCGTILKKIKTAGRGTHYCPTCQI